MARVAKHIFKGSFWVVGGVAAISTTSHPAFGMRRNAWSARLLRAGRRIALVTAFLRNQRGALPLWSAEGCQDVLSGVSLDTGAETTGCFCWPRRAPVLYPVFVASSGLLCSWRLTGGFTLLQGR